MDQFESKDSEYMDDDKAKRWDEKIIRCYRSATTDNE